MPNILISGSDYEGRLGFAQREFADLQEFLTAANYSGETPSIKENQTTGELEFVMPAGFEFKFLGDAIDHGNYDIRIQRALISNANCHSLIGNRDANKLRPKTECKDSASIIRHAMLNDLASWGADNKNRQDPNKCLLHAIFGFLATSYPSIWLKIIIAFQNNSLDLNTFIAEHVRPAQETAANKPVSPLSKKYLDACKDIKEILLDKDVELLPLQETYVRWMLDYTMGCAQNNLWASAFTSRTQEIAELYRKKNGTELEGPDLIKEVIDSYITPSNQYNLSEVYLQKSQVARRDGNILSIHGCLTVDSFKVPGTDLTIDSFEHIDEWIEAINSAYQKSLAEDSGDFSSYAVRFAVDQGRANFAYLIAEYEARGEKEKADNLRQILAEDGTGSTIGNNQILLGEADSNGMREVGASLDPKIVALLKKSAINSIHVGHMPTGNQGLFVQVAPGLELASIDPTYAVQDGTSVSLISIFDEYCVARTIMLSRTTADAPLEYSAIDSEGVRRGISDFSFNTSGAFSFKFNDKVYSSRKEGFRFETTTRSCPIPRSAPKLGLA